MCGGATGESGAGHPVHVARNQWNPLPSQWTRRPRNESTTNERVNTEWSHWDNHFELLRERKPTPRRPGCNDFLKPDLKNLSEPYKKKDALNINVCIFFQSHNNII